MKNALAYCGVEKIKSVKSFIVQELMDLQSKQTCLMFEHKIVVCFAKNATVPKVTTFLETLFLLWNNKLVRLCLGKHLRPNTIMQVRFKQHLIQSDTRKGTYIRLGNCDIWSGMNYSVYFESNQYE